jgi:hypothetical protein
VAELPDSQGGNGSCQQKTTDRGEQERYAKRHSPIGGEIRDLYGSRVLQDEDQQQDKHHGAGDHADPRRRDACSTGALRQT